MSVLFLTSVQTFHKSEKIKRMIIILFVMMRKYFIAILFNRDLWNLQTKIASGIYKRIRYEVKIFLS